MYDAECPTCGAKMTSKGTSSTYLGFFSPPGHNHDDNCRVRKYVCENGHEHIISKRNRCPVKGCNWVGAETCFCHPEKKVKEWPEPYNQAGGKKL